MLVKTLNFNKKIKLIISFYTKYNLWIYEIHIHLVYIKSFYNLCNCFSLSEVIFVYHDGQNFHAEGKWRGREN